MDLLTFVQKDKPEAPENYGCGKCQRFWGGERETALECCSPKSCKDCQTSLERHRHAYNQCVLCEAKARQEHIAQNELANYLQAKKITPDDPHEEMVFWELGRGDCNGDGFFSSLQAVLDECAENNVEPPKYVWTCDVRYLSIDAVTFIENELENGEWYEDAIADISDKSLEELQKFLTEWAESQPLKCYDPNFKVAIVIPEEWRQEAIKKLKEEITQILPSESEE